MSDGVLFQNVLIMKDSFTNYYNIIAIFCVSLFVIYLPIFHYNSII